jgi:hypothetical protein
LFEACAKPGAAAVAKPWGRDAAVAVDPVHRLGKALITRAEEF